jgi:hypothetical protein
VTFRIEEDELDPNSGNEHGPRERRSFDDSSAATEALSPHTRGFDTKFDSVADPHGFRNEWNETSACDEHDPFTGEMDRVGSFPIAWLKIQHGFDGVARDPKRSDFRLGAHFLPAFGSRAFSKQVRSCMGNLREWD